VSIAYLDSSALVKHYIAEVGSDWVKSLLALDRTPTVFTSNMTVVEATCAFARRRREGTLSSQDHAQVLAAFDYDITYRYNMVDVNPMVCLPRAGTGHLRRQPGVCTGTHPGPRGGATCTAPTGAGRTGRWGIEWRRRWMASKRVTAWTRNALSRDPFGSQRNPIGYDCSVQGQAHAPCLIPTCLAEHSW
jgi:hypothetical protein